MSIYAIISFLAFVIYLAFGIYVLKLDPKSRLNRAFVLLAASFAVWSFTYSLYYGAPNEQTAFFWYKISGLGRYLYPVFLLQIALILTKRDIRNNWVFQILIYLPAIIFLYGTFSTPFFIQDLVRINSEWYEILNTNSYWLLFYILYNAVYDISALLLIAIWGYKSTDLRSKKQSQIIFITGLLAFIVGGTIIIIIPMLGIFLFPSIPQLSAVILFLGTFYAIVRYKLLVLTPAIAAEEIVARITDLVIFMDSKGKIIKINQQMEKTMGYNQSELQGKNWSFIIKNLEDREIINKLMSKILLDLNKHEKSFLASKDVEIVYKTRAGEDIPVKSFISVIKDEFGIIGLVVVAQDMRQTKKLQQEIKKRIIAQESANIHAKSLEVLNSIIISVNKADNIPSLLKEVLKSVLKLTNLSSGAVYLLDDDGRNAILEQWKNLPSDFLEKFKRLDTEKKPYNIITKTKFLTGKSSKVFPEKSPNKDLYIAIIPIISQNKTIGNMNIFSKNPVKFSDVDLDILESIGREVGTAINRIKNQNKVIDSLKEKEVLLKEIHHRVKNNMQIISGLLNLESSNVFDKRDESLFQRAQERVQSMALIHSNLYQSKDLSSINFKTYLDTLTSELYCAHAAGSKIEINIDIMDDISLNMETAIPLGLIVNELVSNSLEYAFPQRKGEVYISLKSPNDQFELTVCDNGIGFPEDLNFRNTKTLGLRLVLMLIDQLDGTIELYRGHGTKFKIHFKKLKYEKRF
jgi:PAS domain S-box-containing protein